MRLARVAVAGWVALGAAGGVATLAAQAASPAKVAVSQAKVAVSPAKVAVSPAKAGRHAAFTVSFVAPFATGTTAGHDYAYTVTASTTSGTPRCEQEIRLSPTVTAAPATVRVTLRPQPAGWCVGRYTGAVVETARTHCGPPVMSVNERRGHSASRAFSASHTTHGSFMCPMTSSVIMSEELGSFRYAVSG